MRFGMCHQLSPLQRGAIRRFASLLLVSVGLAALDMSARETGWAHGMNLMLIGLLPALPVAAMIYVVSRYLNEEGDEYIRLMVTRALLWASGAMLFTDVVLAAMEPGSRGLHLAVVLNLDVFCVTVMVAMRVQLWRSR